VVASAEHAIPARDRIVLHLPEERTYRTNELSALVAYAPPESHYTILANGASVATVWSDTLGVIVYPIELPEGKYDIRVESLDGALVSETVAYSSLKERGHSHDTLNAAQEMQMSASQTVINSVNAYTRPELGTTLWIIGGILTMLMIGITWNVYLFDRRMNILQHRNDQLM
jgi:hypothetical protein